MDYPDEADILAEEEFMRGYEDFGDEDFPFEEEPPDLQDLISAAKKGPAASSIPSSAQNLQLLSAPTINQNGSTDSRKRQQDDLFGDLDDLDDDNCNVTVGNDGSDGTSQPKRMKLSEPSTAGCKAAAALNNLFGKKSPEKLDVKIDDDSYLDRLEAIIATKNHSHQASKPEDTFLRRRRYAFKTIPDVPFQSMTNARGERMYMLLKQPRPGSEDPLVQRGSKLRGNLLEVPIATLKLQAEKEKEKKEEERLEAIKKRLESFGSMEFKSKRKRMKEHSEEQDSSWLEAYRPRKYFDLLSHEATNRALLRWLKLWDKVVFNREVKIKPRLQDGSLVEDSKNQQVSNQGGHFKNNRFQKKSAAPDDSVIQELDDKGRPMQKVALLCGPPGLGKTTLAHVVASHAGYNVVEMNASDDRSVEAFKLQLENATQMQSVVSTDPRPNCLIIDEIDGAPAAAINVLLSYIQKQDADKQKGKKKKEGPKHLQRPVICICNDLYAPSLRQLRPIALVLNFPPTESSRLANRLLEIARDHGIDTDLSTLLALCEKSENDIRSCLATLYFFRLQGKIFRLQNVLNASVGVKDSSKSFFSVWQDLFQKQKNGPVSRSSASSGTTRLEQNKSTDSLRYSAILDSVQACGDYERLMTGVFENYHSVKFRDNKLEKVGTGLDWICYYDTIQQQIQHSQNYSMLAFVPHIFVKLHFLFSATERPKITFPKVHMEMNAIQSKNENIVSTLMLEMAPPCRIFTTPRSLVQDILPYVLDCLTPTFRPVSTQLYSPEERQEVLRVVTAMILFSMTYRQERTPDGQYIYVLDPNVEELIYLDKTKQRRQLSYASKQLIAREIELEKMRRNASVDGGEIVAAKPKPAVVDKEKVVPNHLQTLKAKSINLTESKPARDFFGRIINKVEMDKSGDGKTACQKDLLQGDIWFHFKEGYSNAVRRKVRVKDFL